MRLSTKELTITALMTALICVIAPFSIQLPGLVPISLGPLMVYFIAYMLGLKLGTISVVAYIIIGAIGLPVFSGAQGGLGKLTGPTGGYIVGYILLALVIGLMIEYIRDNIPVYVISMIIGTLILYVLGTIWFMVVTGNSLTLALTYCVYPFIVFDIARIILIAIIAPPVRKRLVKAGLLKSYK